MKRLMTAATCVMVACAGLQSVVATPVDVTVFDGRKNTSSNSWYNTKGEDQEVEPGMVRNQDWDLEAFIYEAEDKDLGAVGGFNFEDGLDYGGHHYTAGDIFIDIDDAVNWSDATGNYGYEYVFDINYDDLTYDVVDLRGSTATFDDGVIVENRNQKSRPFNYTTGGTLVSGHTDIGFISGGAGSLGDNYVGDSHYLIKGFDVSFLESGVYNSHMTLSCGNDLLHGRFRVPEPSTLSLMFGGLACLLGFYGLNRKKK